MDISKNHGVLISTPSLTDYILGSTSTLIAPTGVDNWAKYLPDPENQFNSKIDYLNCVTMSAMHSLEAQLNYLLSTKVFSDEALNFFKQNKYLKNDRFDLSARFNAKMNGTDKIRGQYLNTAADHFKNDGCVPEAIWPAGGEITWDEYYKEIPQNIKDLAKKFKWFVNIAYQWVEGINVNSHTLKSAPIQVATQICAGWHSGKIVQKCHGQPIQHATLVYGIGAGGVYLDLDQYPPYIQELAPDYELPYSMQYIITAKGIVLRNGMQGVNCLVLQEDLRKLGYKVVADSFFGPATEMFVKQFQKDNGLMADGIAGPATLSKIEALLNKPKLSKLDQWCQAIKVMEGGKPERNNPGNLEFRNQPFAILDPVSKRFAKFDTYEHGYEALKSLITRACMGKIKAYNPNGNLYDFYAVYAPDSDGNDSRKYAEFVAKRMKVDPNIIIKTLI